MMIAHLPILKLKKSKIHILKEWKCGFDVQDTDLRLGK